ncbi:hypothetical protein EOD41_16095 [Mucilaginibacter limnophilus]|uniref:DUF1360 domain-containing protein n=1 Tax=Mucilaginibacter limnophilus TaxID=1932778 RepID=A0A437MKY7_9SPHI|nr:hypothetical protein [Mucilaginibacter limnophilus]RVT98318.1 hypothetical protein EOD41_16095 [Mucilaginibacter limnophilus]
MLEHALIIAMIVLFIHACSWRGMIFDGIKKIIEPKGHLYKPIYGCPICMTPYYGTIIYLLFFKVSFADGLLTVAAASGLNVVSVLLIDIKDALCHPKEDDTKP